MRLYRIFNHWLHREGHWVTSEYTKEKGPILAENQDHAIEKFKLQHPKMGQYIKKNEKGYFYGDLPHFLSDKKPLEIKEVEL